MARVSNEHRLNFEQAIIGFLTENPSATTEAVGKALYDDWRSPGPTGKRPKKERSTDWAKRKLKALSKVGKVFQPSRGIWEANKVASPIKKTTKLRKKAKTPVETFTKSDNGNGSEPFTPVNVFNIDEPASFYEVVGNNSPFIKGLLSTAERHGSVELPEPMLHALIEEMAMAFGRFDN